MKTILFGISQIDSAPADREVLVKGTINERLASRGTAIFGSMWTFYAFIIYGALGAIFVAHQATLLYWSNWIQLWSMPLLMVGGLVIGKASERRAQQTHEDASSILDRVQQIQVHLNQQDEQISKLASEIKKSIKVGNGRKMREESGANNLEIFR